MARKLKGWGLAVAGATLGAVWAIGKMSNPFTPVAALLLILAGASLFGKASRFAERMSPLVGKKVHARVWDAELAGDPRSEFTIHAVRAIGAGLHLYLQPSAGGASIHLKVVQPQEVDLDESGVQIGEAKYVQWAGKKIAKVAGKKALLLKTISN